MVRERSPVRSRSRAPVKYFKEFKAMAKNRVIITFKCEVCKMKNYSKLVSKKRAYGKLALNKYCSKCRKHQVHNETK